MTRIFAMTIIMLGCAFSAQAQDIPQQPSAPPMQQAADPASGAPVAQMPAAQGQEPSVAGQPNAMQPQPGVAGLPQGAVAGQAAPADRASMMRDLQEQGREAVNKSRALQATDPAAANKIMQDYYQLRADKMREMQKTARTQAAEERAKKREEAKVKAAAAQAERAAVKRDAKNARQKQQEVGGRGFPREKDSDRKTQ